MTPRPPRRGHLSRARLGLAVLGAAALGGVFLVGGSAGQSRPPQPRAPEPPPAAAAPERREPPVIDESKAEASPRAPATTVPSTGPGPTIDIPLADGLPGGRLGPGDLPPAWHLKRFAGHAQFELARDDGRPAFRLISQASSFAIHREVAIDVQQFPVLSWAWKVLRLPPRGDVRDGRANDQAAQVYVIFPRAPGPRMASDVLGYVWDTQAPVGHRAANAAWPNVRVIVLQSGADRVGRWVREERNVRQDYAELFKREAPAAGLVAVMTDSDDTRTSTEAFFSGLAFQRAAAPSRPEPTRRN